MVSKGRWKIRLRHGQGRHGRRGHREGPHEQIWHGKRGHRNGWLACSISRRSVKAATAITAVLAVAASTASPSHAFTSVGSEIIVIDSVDIQSPVMTTYDKCSGYVDHDVPVIPVTVRASFITRPGVTPTGPYGGVLAWDGGFGAEDDHFGTGQAHAPVQLFHVLARSSSFYYYGPGKYSFELFVQDVGTAGGFTTAERTVTLPGPPPSGAGASVKCTIAKPYGLGDVLSGVAQAGIEQVGAQLCPLCAQIKSAIENVEYYKELTDEAIGNSAIKDPPDSNYQQIAQPQAPPILPPPSGLTPSQQAAVTEVETQFTQDIGLVRAMSTTQDRVWGADNAGSRYWYVKQMRALSQYAGRLADDLGGYQSLYEALQATLAPELEPFSITYSDALKSLVKRSEGYSSAALTTLSELGASSADQQQLIDDAIAVDPGQMIRSDGVSALFAENEADFAAPMRAIARWASNAAAAQPPIISDVSPKSIPSGGGTQVTITGVNLATVKAIDFGPSTPLGGTGRGTSCTDTQCTTYAPPGARTVDVVAVGPGGPSDIVAADKVTYVEPLKPEITSVFPREGTTAGGTNVSIRGAGLSGGIVYFGPTAASSWRCSDTLCSAEAPPSAASETVDIQVVNPGGTSSTGTADRFQYVYSPLTPPQPQVSGVSPASGADSGGDTVTITGSGFTGATEVLFGEGPAESYEVIDDSHIEATTPATYKAETVDVTVAGPGGASSVNAPADQFSFEHSPPTITGISPASGSDLGGTAFTITGTHLAGGSGAQIYIGSEYVEDAVCSETQCHGTSPPGADGPVEVKIYTYDGQASLAGAFTYEPGPAPTIGSVTPDTGVVDGGTDVVIAGTNLRTGHVAFGEVPATEATCTQTVCIATAPPAPKAEQVDIHITTNAGTTATTPADDYGYVHIAQPVIDSVSPASGYVQGGTEVHLTGTDLTNGSVAFGDTEAYESKCMQTSCDVQAPPSSTSGPVDITVTTASGTSQPSGADRFDYVVPAITGVSPSQGWTLGGTEVTITGTNLGGTAEEPVEETAFFGSTAVTATCAETSCTVTSPAAATNAASPVDVRVHPTGGTESETDASDTFTYVPRPAPTVVSVTPTSGVDAGGDEVTVTGTDLQGGAVKFGDAVAAGTCSETSCTVTSPLSGVGDETVDVTVTTPTLGESLTSATTSADRFTYAAPGVPQITGVSPDHGTVVGGTTVTIEGSNLTHGTVTFGGVAATDVSCRQDSCTVTSPKAASAETVDVVASTAGGASATSSADSFTYEIPPTPTVTSISPAEGPASGDSEVTVTGTDLRGGSVAFGGQVAAGVTCRQTTCTATSPPGAARQVDVTVSTPGGTSAASTADRFTYSPVTLTEHAISGVSAATGGGEIVRGIGGDLWFTMPDIAKVGRVAADGTVTTYDTLDSGSRPWGITEGPDGKMWYTEREQDKLVSIDSEGKQSGQQLPGGVEDLRYVTSGPDGRLWFTLGASGTIGAMTMSGDFSLYHLPDPTVFPYYILTGPDGRLWFTEVYGDSIGAIGTNGTVTEYPLPDSGDGGWGLTVGTDNRLWFGEWNARAIGAITTSGRVTQYPVPTAGDDPQGVIAGADGQIWFTAPDSDLISALDPATGAVTNYPLPGPESGGLANEAPRYLAMDGEGKLWVTENQRPHLLSVSGLTAAAAPTVTGVAPNNGGAGTAVAITGADLGQASAVNFGSTPATAYTVIDPAHITATAPAGSGIVHVTVTTSNGTSSATPLDRFSYGAAIPAQPAVTGVSPESGTIDGRTTVTITGRDLSDGTVTFGTSAATDVSCTDTSCTATSPASATAGPVDVTITTSGGTSEVVDADRFVYLAPLSAAPTVAGISPASGSDTGGTAVTITGTGLSDATVAFGLVS